MIFIQNHNKIKREIFQQQIIEQYIKLALLLLIIISIYYMLYKYTQKSTFRKIIHISIGTIYIDLVPKFLDIFYKYNKLIPLILFLVYIQSSTIKDLLNQRVMGIIEYFIAFCIYPFIPLQYRHQYHSSLILLTIGDGISGYFHNKSNLKKTYINPIKSYAGIISFCICSSIYLCLTQYIDTQSLDFEQIINYIKLSLYTGLIELLPSGEHDNILIIILSMLYQIKTPQSIQLLTFAYISFYLYQLHCFTYNGALSIILLTFVTYNTKKLVFYSIIVFGILGSITGKINRHFIKNKKERKGRSAYQVFENSIVSIIFLIIYLITKDDKYILASIAAVAECISDTFSSDLGTILNKNDYVHYIIGFKKVPKGYNGGISIIGTFLGFLGSIIISILDFYVYRNIQRVIMIIIAAFIGNLSDSIMGQLLQGNEKNKQIISNGQVNILGSLISSLIILIVKY